MLILILLSLILATSANPFQTLIAPAENGTNNSDRLPSTTIPSKYSIDLEVPNDSLNGKNVSFNGNVKIKLRVLEPTSKIYLHSAVTVLNISLTDSNNNHIPIINSNKNATTNILMILFKSFLSPSVKYSLKIFYTQNFTTDTIKGCSRIEYDDNGKKEYLVITQFQHSYARFAFPCFDEPGFKAVFTLRVTHPKKYNALSNMPVKETFINNDTKTTLFQESPKMSSYLVAFTISKLTCTESEQRDINVQFRVCTRDKFSSDRTLALEYAIKIIKAMTAWTNYSYSLGNTKIDEVVVPGITDLAMENWGMVTYHEYMILYNENDTSNDFKQGIIDITAHEFAHQWFGNLVTTSWWNTLFLNEGFATYFQYKLFNWIGLEHYEMDKQFIIKQQQIALSDDSYSDAQSLTSDASTDDDIEDKFGTITYSKGASIIAMIANFMGQRNFQQGLQRYLKKNDFQSVTPDKLWDSFSNLGNQYLPDGLSWAEIVDNWINKRGFPLISATLNENDVKLSQKQFSYDDETNTQWYVPITYLTSINRIGIVWLKPNSTVVLKNVVDNNGGWIIINHNARGYFRVKYDNVLSRRIRTALTTNPFRFTDLDKTQIIDDTFSLALAGQLKYMEVFQIIRFLKHETSYYPWDAAIRGFNQLRLKFDDDSDIVHHINSVLLNLIEDVFVDISATNWNNIDHIFGLKSSLIWEATCKAAHKICISLTKSLFQKFKDDNVRINPNIRQAIYCNALRYSEDIETDWYFLWNKSLTTDQPHERIYLLESLGCTNNKDLLKFYINESFKMSPLEFEVIWGAIHRSSSTGLNIAFDYFVNNHNKIMKQEKILLLLCALLFSGTKASPHLIPKPRISEDVERVLNEDYRLPSTIKPISYEIILQVPLEALEGVNTDFSGQVKILFNFVTSDVDRILIHSLVNISSVSLYDNSENNQTLVATSLIPNVTTEITTILPDNNIPFPNTTTYTLDISYNGNLETVDMQGFYRSQYTNGVLTEYLATTQFQPTHARKVFPCFDEPQYKATFNLSITHPTGFRAISNTPGESVVSSEPGYDITTFNETPIMSTYLLAFTISKFTCTQSTGTPTYGVCSRTDLASQRDLALEYGDKLMDALDTWSNLNYSTMGIAKVDQIAIPDFSAGAMENWGMVTYREYLLLSDEAHTSNAYKQRIITIIAHEYAHMWFGNLITTEWWDTLFLNEGFATYFEYLLLTQLEELQSYEMHKQFITDVHQNALASDASSSSPSLTSEAWSPSQIWSKFNTISYDKGGSIIRMVENVIGSANFQASLQQYILNNQFQTSTPAILWSSFNTYLQNANIAALAANVSFIDFVDNWTNLPGYPVVNATLNGTNIILTQNRFLYNGNDSTEWYVPIYYKSLNSDVINSIWLRPDSNSVTIENVNIPDNMVIINVNSSAFFRVNYDITLRQRIISTLESNHLLITDVDRAQILDDILSLARARYIEYSEALQVLNYLRSETSYYPWLSAIRGLNFLSLRLGNDTELGQHLNNKILQLIEIASANISTTNWNSTEHVTGMKFQMLWNAACRAGQQSCISESRRLFAEFKTNGTIIHPNIRNVVYCNALRHSNDVTDFDFLWDRLQTVVDPHETIFILTTIGCTRDTNQLVNLLSQTINDSSIIRIQDFSTVWSSVYTSSSVGLQVAFDFFRSNHSNILTYNPGASSLLSAITSRFTSTAEILQLEEFTNELVNHPIIGTSATAALNSARQNLEWHQSIEDNLRTYFNDNPITDTTGTGATGTSTTASPIPTTESSSTTLNVSFSVTFAFVILVKLFMY